MRQWACVPLPPPPPKKGLSLGSFSHEYLVPANNFPKKKNIM